KAISRIIKTCDCYQYLRFLKQLADSNFRSVECSSTRHALMCHYDFWQKSGVDLGFSSIEQSITALSDQHYSAELADLLDFLLDGIKHAQTPMPNLPDVPLHLHARYSREQILVGFGATTFERKSPSREGVLLLKEQNIELLFVTLNKNEKQFSPTTMYHDYAINDELFHWQTQNSARPDRGRGLEYIQHRALGKRIFLFVREQAKDEFGKTFGFVNFGEVNYVQHNGAQPMNVTWRLSTRMPAFMWQHAAKLAIG
ncbi:MAG TPA: DUF3427 domain-containing protein, partial [Rheinheimera sp.]|nr:DUF3427 domain-containing protein [Rheinheimera sp.]